MKYFRFALSILVIVLIFISCSKQSTEPNTTQHIDLLGTWTGTENEHIGGSFILKFSNSTFSAYFYDQKSESAPGAGYIVTYDNETNKMILYWTDHPADDEFEGKYTKITWSDSVTTTAIIQLYMQQSTQSAANNTTDTGDYPPITLTKTDESTCIIPMFNPSGAMYSDAQDVEIICFTSGATIRYTTDGSNPTSASTHYTAPIHISTDTTIKAKAFKVGLNDSAIASATYIISSVIYIVPTPTFAPTSGTYYSNQSVRINCVQPAATIRYTLNGTNPNTSSPIYTNPIITDGAVTIKAKAYKEGWNPSAVAIAIYSFQVGSVYLSINSGTYTSPQTVMIHPVSTGTVIHYTTDGSDPTEDSSLYASPILISENTTLKVRGYIQGWSPSPMVTANYIINLPPK